MNPKIGHFYRYDLHRNTSPAFTHELARRMSPLQRSLLSAMATFEKAEPEAFDYAFRQLQTPVYFASSLGELDALIKVTEGVFKPNVPVSPAAFQNSVHNAAPAYFAIAHKFHAPHIAISDGFASPDRALYLALQNLRLGLSSCICVAAANESYPESEDVIATCELFLLFDNSQTKSPLVPNREILSCSYTDRNSIKEVTTSPHFQHRTQVESLTGPSHASFTDLFTHQVPVCRVVEDAAGDRFTSLFLTGKSYPTITDIIPHRRTMKLVDRLIFAHNMKGQVSAIVRDTAPYWQEGVFEKFWCLEIMAQSVAAVYGYETNKLGQKTKLGFLVAIDEFAIRPELQSEPIEVGDELISDVVQTHEILPLGLYTIQLDWISQKHKTRRSLASARMKFSIADDSIKERILSNAY